jgi:hypothetical protein
MDAEKKYGNMKMFLIVLLVLNLLVSVYGTFLKKDAYRLETLKVGGTANMNMARQLYESDQYKQQQKATLDQILGSLDTAGTTPPTVDTAKPTTDTASATQGDSAKFAAIEKDGYIKGNKDARITIIEYSDMLCPFCKRHYNAQTLESLVTKYPNDVNMIFRQMPLPQLHPTAPI